MWSQDKYVEAMNFAAVAHGEQKVPGKPFSYVVHLAEVAAEVMAGVSNAEIHGEPLDADIAIQCALLHDVIEDAGISYDEICERFGNKVADGVLALTKDEKLDKVFRMSDSLQRIQKQPKEIWMVKLADRITNLQSPPAHWTMEKRAVYKAEAAEIHNTLKEASPFLAERLMQKIERYKRYL